MKHVKKLIPLLALAVLLSALGGLTLFARAETVGRADLVFSSMTEGEAVVDVVLADITKKVDYVQAVLIPKTAAAAPGADSVTTEVANLGIDSKLAPDGTLTVLAVPTASGVAMENGTTVFSFLVDGTQTGDVLAYTVKYILCYTDGTDCESTVEDSVTVSGTFTSRLEAETDSIYWRYLNNTEAGVGDSNYAVGGIQPGTAANMQSFEELAAGEALKKTEHPMVSFIVDAPVAGDYTLNITYRGTVPDGYFMVVDVDDTAYAKSAYVSAHPDDSRYHITSATVNLTAGRHTIRLITMLADTSGVSWVNVDCVDVTGPGKLTGVAPQWTHLQAWDASYNNKFTATAANTKYASVADWYAEMLGGYQGDGAAASAGIEAGDGVTKQDLPNMGYYAYTVYVPASGFYDLQTYIMCYSDTAISAKQRTGHIMLLVDDNEALWFPAEYGYSALKWNAQNLSCYLTEGYHTLAVSGIVGADPGGCSMGWCDMGALSVSGGITVEAVTQTDPLGASIVRNSVTLLLEELVQTKYLFDINGIEVETDDSGVVQAGGLLVWRGGDITADSTYEKGTETYAVSGLTRNGTVYTAVANGVAGKEMADGLVARGYLLVNGQYYYSEKIQFNAADYSNSVLQSGEPEHTAAKPVAAAKLIYGAAAQTYFGYNTGSLMNAGVPEDLLAHCVYRDSMVVETAAAPACGFASDATDITMLHSLELKDNVWLRYVFARKSIPEDAQDLKLLYWPASEGHTQLTADNAAQLELNVNGSYYTAAIKGIAPKNMGQTFFACVTYTDSQGTHYSALDTYSIHKYAAAILEGSYGEDLTNLCKALIVYSHEAKQYFAIDNTTVYISDSGDDYNPGTAAEPVKTLDEALTRVADGGTVSITDSFTAGADFVWPTSTKAVTVTGGTMDFANQSTVNINSPVTFSAVALTFADGSEIFANGNKTKIGSDVTVNGSSLSIFGGGNNGTTVASTDLTVLSGTYTAVYGGGAGASGSANYAHVAGTARLVVGGSVNSSITPGDSAANDVFGGCRRGTVDTTDVTFTGNAKARYVCGGGSGSNSGDWCDYGTTNLVMESGTAVSLYGGNRYGSGSKDNAATNVTNVTIEGGTVEQIFGGHEFSTCMYGSANIYLKGGTVTRRVVGGCYNNYSLTDGWTDPARYVTGDIAVYVYSGAAIAYEGTDWGLIAASRHASDVDGGTKTIAFADQDTYEKHKEKLGIYWSIGTLVKGEQGIAYDTLLTEIAE